jgi:glutamate-1-semialdehyde 2,1-aminomutase
MSYSERLHKVIPAGCHTYSRGDDQFPSNAPQILVKGEGAYVWDSEGNKYLDYGMGIRAVACGYGETSIINAALDGMLAGNCLTRPSMIELEASELACDLLGLDMIKFTKNGSTATSAAVKLARAYTGREGICYPSNQPFFSYDDWFIAGTSRNAGVPSYYEQRKFDDVGDLLILLTHIPTPAAIIMEPREDSILIQDICKQRGIVFILDEMITGFRYKWPSVAKVDGLQPDLACYGKAMANGFSVACVGGKREIMELGARPDMFLASTTHGAEMSGLAAFIATVAFMEKHNVAVHISEYAEKLWQIIPKLVGVSQEEKTLFHQEMIRNGVMMPWIAPCYRHGDKELKLTERAIEKSLISIELGAKLEGNPIRPVFAA